VTNQPVPTLSPAVTFALGASAAGSILLVGLSLVGLLVAVKLAASPFSPAGLISSGKRTFQEEKP
jgi:hypothetical protein